MRTAPAGLAALDRIEIVLVDDAQELTLGGVELVEACVRRGITAMAFGDPDVGSGAFRGATPENFARLAASLGDTWVLGARIAARAWQADLVRRVTQRIGAVGVVAHRHAAVGRRRRTARCARSLLRSPAEEFDAIARLLRERHVHDGVAWGDCAVIAHDSRQVAALEAELAAREVPARSSGPGPGARRARAGARPAAPHRAGGARRVDVRGGLRARCSAPAAASTRSSCGGCARRCAMPRSASERVRRADGRGRRAGALSGSALLVSAMHRPLEFDLHRHPRGASRRRRSPARSARCATSCERGATVHELLWTAWDRSGLERAWSELARGHGPLAEQANRDLDAVVALFQAAKRFVERSLDADPRAFVRGILDSDVAEDRLDAPMRDDTVRILTPAGIARARVRHGRDRRRAGRRLAEHPAPRRAARHLAARGCRIPRRRRVLRHARPAPRGDARRAAAARARAQPGDRARRGDRRGRRRHRSERLLRAPARAGAAHASIIRCRCAGSSRSTGGRSPVRPAPRAPRGRPVSSPCSPTRACPARRRASGTASREPTSTGPLRDLAREDVRVSPSRLHTLEECELNWVIGDLGGDPGGATAGLGTIIHAALEHAEGSDEASLWAQVEARWGELTFEAEWRDRAERTRARDLVRRLHVYLRRFEQSGGSLIGAEPHFEVAIPLEDAEAFEHGVILSGYIDRVELTPEGAVVIVDLKTGKREPQTNAKVVDNPQLGAYQLAFEAGAIPQAIGHPSGGAKLLVLRPTATRSDYAEPWQPPFDDERREQFLARIREAVSVMRGTSFTAPYEEHCRDEFSYGLCRIHTIGAVSAS